MSKYRPEATKRWVAKQKANGKCVSCRNDTRPGKSTCIACAERQSRNAQARYAANAEMEREKARERRRRKPYEYTPEQKARKAAWAKEYVKRNREKINAARRAYCAKNPEWARARDMHRRVKRRNLMCVQHFTADDVAATLTLQSHRCFYCLASLLSGYEVDHMTPLSRGGSNGAENIVCACRACNRKKHKQTAAEFILGKKWIKDHVPLPVPSP